MMLVRIGLFLSVSCAVHGVDVSNLGKCIEEVQEADAFAVDVPTFDKYVTNYGQLIGDLQVAMGQLPYVYQEAAAKPLIGFLETLGEAKYRSLFSENSSNESLKEIIPDAALAILFHEEMLVKSNAFQEVVSDLYDSFIKEGRRTGKETGMPIKPPTYGVIPPLVKFGNAEYGPYTWPGDATYHLLGMRCAIVSLPPAQANGGLLAWTALGHETGGHDVMHADRGLLDELGEKVYSAILREFNNKQLADYWYNCIDESVADVCGYLNMGPSIGVGLIGYFRALGNGQLSTLGYSEGPHPIDLLRGYLAAAVAKRLPFKDALEWSEVIALETSVDNRRLRLINSSGSVSSFPASFDEAIASTEVVAQTILRSNLVSLENHSLQGIQNWRDTDQAIVDKLILAFKKGVQLPKHLDGPGFYAAHVVAAATQAALEEGAQVEAIFSVMQAVLSAMHLNNPVWSQDPTVESIARFEQTFRELEEGDASTYRAIALFEPTFKGLEEVENSDASSVATR